MPQWTTFAAFAGVVLFGLLFLSRLTNRTASGPPALPPAGTDARDSRFDHPAAPSATDLSPGLLLVNVALSQGVFCGVLLAGVAVAGVPLSALGVTTDPASVGASALLAGVGLGVALYAGNELAMLAFERLDLAADESLRESLTPDSAAGWAVLLLGVLPIVAVFEELLFRAALIGGLSAGFGVSPWLLVALSAVAFGLGHGMQGVGGMVVTGGLGLVLGSAFVLTGSLLAVVVAHYLVNALEFLVHEGLGVTWGGRRS